MAAELRWILLALGCRLLGRHLVVERARRSGAGAGQCGAARDRRAEPSRHDDRAHRRSTCAGRRPETARVGRVRRSSRLSIHTADFDACRYWTGPMMIDADPEPIQTHGPDRGLGADADGGRATLTRMKLSTARSRLRAAHCRTSPRRRHRCAVPAVPTHGRRAPTPSRIARRARRAGPADQRKADIVTVRVCAAARRAGPAPAAGGAWKRTDWPIGRYQVFHRKHVDGRSMFCVASLIEPGTFDVAADGGAGISRRDAVRRAARARRSRC